MARLLCHWRQPDHRPLGKQVHKSPSRQRACHEASEAIFLYSSSPVMVKKHHGQRCPAERLNGKPYADMYWFSVK